MSETIGWFLLAVGSVSFGAFVVWMAHEAVKGTVAVYEDMAEGIRRERQQQKWLSSNRLDA